MQTTERKACLIADNLRVHHGRKVRAWAQANRDRIELFFIPSYSPEINPDEYLNRDIKRNVHEKRAPKTLKELKENVPGFPQKLPARVMKYFNSPKV